MTVGNRNKEDELRIRAEQQYRRDQKKIKAFKKSWNHILPKEVKKDKNLSLSELKEALEIAKADMYEASDRRYLKWMKKNHSSQTKKVAARKLQKLVKELPLPRDATLTVALPEEVTPTGKKP